MAKSKPRRLLEQSLATDDYDTAALIIVTGALEYLTMLQAERRQQMSPEERFAALGRFAYRRQGLPVGR